MTNLVYMHENMEVIEDSCKRFIDEEIELFMKSCEKAAYVFSVMISKDLSNYSKEAFEEMVVSPQEIDNLIGRVHYRICNNLGFAGGSRGVRPLSVNTEEFDLNQKTINSRIEDYRMTNRITKASEVIITNSFSLILGNVFSSNIIDVLFSQTKIGEKIINKNNSRSQSERFQKEIYRHIEGALINMKTKLRNELMMQLSGLIGEQGHGIQAAV